MIKNVKTYDIWTRVGGMVNSRKVGRNKGERMDGMEEEIQREWENEQKIVTVASLRL